MPPLRAPPRRLPSATSPAPAPPTGALRLFGEMPVADRNAVSWTAVTGALMRAGRVCRMLQCHNFCVLRQRSCPRCFYALFEGMPRKNVISWGMIKMMWAAGRMKPTPSTLACADVPDILLGLQMAKLRSLANLYSSTPGH
uniref:Pentatricopeptide repeat-containing protein n=1 Tax=Oryza meridionalis TaxID=40149 RepID=A0A0E0BZV5_9ORYZ